MVTYTAMLECSFTDPRRFLLRFSDTVLMYVDSLHLHGN
jgi:hypothetical protein